MNKGISDLISALDLNPILENRLQSKEDLKGLIDRFYDRYKTEAPGSYNRLSFKEKELLILYCLRYGVETKPLTLKQIAGVHERPVWFILDVFEKNNRRIRWQLEEEYRNRNGTKTKSIVV